MNTGFSQILKSRDKAYCKAPFAAVIFPESIFITAVKTWASTLSGSFVTQSWRALSALGMSFESHFAFAKMIWASAIEGYCLKTFSNNFIAFCKNRGCYSPLDIGLLFASSKYSLASSIRKSALSFV